MNKTSVTYIYSQDCKTASYLQYLIDKIRVIDLISFNSICIEEENTSTKNINKIKKEIDDLIEAKKYELAADKRAYHTRLSLAKKYSNILPVVIVRFDTEHEIVTTGSKKSLAAILDFISRVNDASKFMESLNLSAMGDVVSNVISEINKVKTAGRGLETIKGGT